MKIIDILLIITILIPLISLYKYKKISMEMSKVNIGNITGCEVSEAILSNTYVIEKNSILSNYYNSNRNIVLLDKNTFHGDSIVNICESAFIASEGLLTKKESILYRLRVTLLPILYLLTLLVDITVILTLILGVEKYIELSIASVFIIELIYIFTFYMDNKICKKAALELKIKKLIKKSEIELVDKMLNSLRYKKIASIILLPIYSIKYLIRGN